MIQTSTEILSESLKQLTTKRLIWAGPTLVIEKLRRGVNIFAKWRFQI